MRILEGGPSGTLPRVLYQFGQRIISDTLGIRLPVDFANFYQIAQSTSGTESYSEGLTLIASILHKIVSKTVSEWT